MTTQQPLPGPWQATSRNGRFSVKSSFHRSFDIPDLFDSLRVARTLTDADDVRQSGKTIHHLSSAASASIIPLSPMIRPSRVQESTDDQSNHNSPTPVDEQGIAGQRKFTKRTVARAVRPTVEALEARELLASPDLSSLSWQNINADIAAFVPNAPLSPATLQKFDDRITAIEATKAANVITPSVTVMALKSDTANIALNYSNMPAGMAIRFGSVTIPLAAGNGTGKIPLSSFTTRTRTVYTVQLINASAGAIVQDAICGFGVQSGQHTYWYDAGNTAPIPSLSQTISTTLTPAQQAEEDGLKAVRNFLAGITDMPTNITGLTTVNSLMAATEANQPMNAAQVAMDSGLKALRDPLQTNLGSLVNTANVKAIGDVPWSQSFDTELASLLPQSTLTTIVRQAPTVRLNWGSSSIPGALGEINPHPGSIANQVLLNATNGTLLVAGQNGVIDIRHAATGALISQLSGHPGGTSSLALTKDGRRLLSIGNDGSAILWDLTNGSVLSRMSAAGNPTSPVDISPDGKYAVFATTVSGFVVIDMQSGAIARTMDVNRGFSLTNGKFDPLNPNSFSMDYGGSFYTYNVSTLLGESRLLFNIGVPVTATAYSPDGSLLVSATSDRNLTIFNNKTHAPLSTVACGMTVASMTMTQSGMLVIADPNGRIRIWDASTALSGGPVTQLPQQFEGGAPVTSLSATPDGTAFLATAQTQTGSKTIAFPLSASAAVSTVSYSASPLSALDARIAAIESQRTINTISPSVTITALHTDANNLQIAYSSMPAGMAVRFGSVTVPLAAGNGTGKILLSSFTSGNRTVYTAQLINASTGAIVQDGICGFGVQSGQHTYVGYGYDPSSGTVPISSLAVTAGSLPSDLQTEQTGLKAVRTLLSSVVDAATNQKAIDTVQGSITGLTTLVGPLSLYQRDTVAGLKTLLSPLQGNTASMDVQKSIIAPLASLLPSIDTLTQPWSTAGKGYRQSQLIIRGNALKTAADQLITGASAVDTTLSTATGPLATSLQSAKTAVQMAALKLVGSISEWQTEQQQFDSQPWGQLSQKTLDHLFDGDPTSVPQLSVVNISGPNITVAFQGSTKGRTINIGAFGTGDRFVSTIPQGVGGVRKVADFDGQMQSATVTTTISFVRDCDILVCVTDENGAMLQKIPLHVTIGNGLVNLINPSDSFVPTAAIKDDGTLSYVDLFAKAQAMEDAQRVATASETAKHQLLCQITSAIPSGYVPDFNMGYSRIFQQDQQNKLMAIAGQSGIDFVVPQPKYWNAYLAMTGIKPTSNGQYSNEQMYAFDRFQTDFYNYNVIASQMVSAAMDCILSAKHGLSNTVGNGFYTSVANNASLVASRYGGQVFTARFNGYAVADVPSAFAAAQAIIDKNFPAFLAFQDAGYQQMLAKRAEFETFVAGTGANTTPQGMSQDEAMRVVRAQVKARDAAIARGVSGSDLITYNRGVTMATSNYTTVASGGTVLYYAQQDEAIKVAEAQKALQDAIALSKTMGMGGNLIESQGKLLQLDDNFEHSKQLILNSLQLPINSSDGTWYIQEGSPDHTGIEKNAVDINLKYTANADLGKPVFAMADGMVVAVDESQGKLILRHDIMDAQTGRSITFFSEYLHLQDIQTNLLGTSIQRGQNIASIGQVGSTTAELHLNVVYATQNLSQFASLDIRPWLAKCNIMASSNPPRGTVDIGGTNAAQSAAVYSKLGLSATSGANIGATGLMLNINGAPIHSEGIFIKAQKSLDAVIAEEKRNIQINNSILRDPATPFYRKINLAVFDVMSANMIVAIQGSPIVNDLMDKVASLNKDRLNVDITKIFDDKTSIPDKVFYTWDATQNGKSLVATKIVKIIVPNSPVAVALYTVAIPEKVALAGVAETADLASERAGIISGISLLQKDLASRVANFSSNETVIDGIRYSTHAIEEMAEEGIYPSFVQYVLKNGIKTVDPFSSELRYRFEITNFTFYDKMGNAVTKGLRVVIDAATNRVITTTVFRLN